MPGLPEILVKHKGRVLDASTIIAIVEEASVQPDRRIPIDGFEPMELRGFVFAVERYADCLEDLKPLHAAHWQETEKHRHGLRFDYDYDGMLRMEHDGRLLLCTIRHDGELVGHTTMKLSRSMHTQTRFAEEDSLFLRADRRGDAFAVLAFLEFVVSALESLGVVEIRCSTKLINGADKLLRRAGFNPVAVQLVRMIGETK